MKRRMIISAIAATLLLGANTLFAKDVSAAQGAQKLKLHTKSENKVINNAVKNEKKFSKVALDEIKDGFHSIVDAMVWIKQNKIDEAKDSLKVAIKKFDLALKNDPSLSLVPLDVSTDVYQFAADAKTIKAAVSTAKKLLEKNKVQEARRLLMPMRDDMEITTVYIPMDTYPLAIKTALKELEKGQKDAALLTLEAVMHTMVASRVIIPIPLVLAQDLIKQASNMDKNKKDEIDKLLQKAKKELTIAALLGYTDKHSKEYKDLISQIENIEKEMKGKNEVVKLYEHLKESFKALFKKVRSESYKDTVGKEEAKALQNPSSVKGHASAKAKVEETEAKDMFEAKEKGKFFRQEAIQDKNSVK